MRKITPFLFLGIILLSLIACQKEESLETLGIAPGNGGTGPGGSGGGGSTNGTEVGTWKFVNARQVFNQTVEANVPGMGVLKSVYSADFTTINNSGTIKFDGTSATITDLAADINATMKVSSSLGGVSSPATSVPLTGSLPASSYTSDYKKIGTDSLYFADGFIEISVSGSGSSSGQGFKLKWDGDKMTLTNVFDESTTEVVNGVSAKAVEHTVTTITLQKQ